MRVPRLPKIRAFFERTPEPKEWVVLEGSAHDARDPEVPFGTMTVGQR